MENNNENNYYNSDEINLITLIKKMVSHTKLILITVILALAASLFYGFVLYEPQYDLRASYEYKLTPNTTFASLYGIEYVTAEDVFDKMTHLDTVKQFISDKGLDSKKYNPETFLKDKEITLKDKIITVSFSKKSEKGIAIYKDYINYCVDQLNNSIKEKIGAEINNTTKEIEAEITQLNNQTFNNEDVNTANYNTINTLKDTVKQLNTQKNIVDNGAIKTFSEFKETKASARGKTMVIICFAVLVIGAAIDFFMSFIDTHIYFSDDIDDNRSVSKHVLSYIPLYKNNELSKKEFEYILNKLDDKKEIAVTAITSKKSIEIISKGLKANTKDKNIIALPSFTEDPNVLKSIKDNCVTLVILNAGENTVTEAKNFVNDCKLINAENYYFIINGINVSDKAVTKFEDNSKYIKYNIFTFRSYREHYKKYLG